MNSQNWKSILADEPDNELVRFTYGKALLDEQKFKEAAFEFEILIKQKEDYALAWAYLARARLMSGDREGARAACEAGLPVAQKQCHEIPLEEIQAVLDDLDSEF